MKLRVVIRAPPRCCRHLAGYVFSWLVGTARCAVPARVLAGGTNNQAALPFEGVAPLHAARTSQRNVPTTLTRAKHIPCRQCFPPNGLPARRRQHTLLHGKQ